MSKIDKTKIYHEILSKKEYLTVLKDNSFKFEFPKKAFDRICQFYGNQVLKPISFCRFVKSIQETEIKKMATVSKVLGEREIGNILDISDCFAIIPNYYHDIYDEAKMAEISPILKNQMMKDIVKKAGMQWDLLIDYCDIQIVDKQIKETSKIIISYELVDNVFKYIPLLQIVFENGEKVDCSFYSYKNILDKSGINLDKMIPYLHHEVKDIDRAELEREIIPLYEKVKLRQLRDKINHGNFKDQKINFDLAMKPCQRFDKIPFDMVKIDQNEAHNLLNDLIKKVEDKKNKIKKYYENIDNQIIEIKDKDKKNTYIRKNIFDKIINDEEPNFDEYKTNDINGNEITLSKKVLLDYKDNSPMVKIYNKNNPKEDYILIDNKDIEDNLNNFTFVRQEETFKGKNKNDETLEEEWVVMDVEFNELPKLDESKPLYTIPEKENLFGKTKKDLLDELNKDNKDIILYNINNNFIPMTLVKEIKDRDKNVKNKNIKYKIKNQINKKDDILVEYKDIFDKEKSPELIIIDNEDNPYENIAVNKNDLIKELNNWNTLNKDIKIKNEVNNNEIVINPQKIKITKLEKENIPKNFEIIQEEIKKQITPEKIIIKTDDNIIKKAIAKKIIDNNDQDYDIYYIKDIDGKKIKVSKKKLEKDNEDPNSQLISISTKEEPNKNIIIPTQEIIKQIDLNPMEESFSVNDKDGNKLTIKKTSIKINPLEIEDINFDEQPNKIKNNIIKDIKDYYYLYKDPENKSYYIRGDILKKVKNYKSEYPIENFEIEDEKGNKFIIPKEIAVKIIDNPNEIKYISLDDEENKGEPIMADLELFKKGEGEIDEPIPINKDGKTIKLKKIKVKKLKDIDSLGEQTEENQYEIIYNLIKKLQKDNPSIDIYKVKDSTNNDIFIYEDTINKIEENKEDPKKTTYKGKSPLKEEIICGKKIIKSSPNKYIKLLGPNIIVDKKDLENTLKAYKPSNKIIKIKDVKGSPKDIDPLKIKIYEPSSEETDVTKILPADFSDINEKLLIDIIPQNKLILINHNNIQPSIIKKKEGDNLIKYPKTSFDTFILYDKDGKKIKVSRKNAEKNVNDNKFEYIEIIDKTNNENKNEIVLVNELLNALKDKENEEFDIKNKDGKKIKLNKKKITIVKQNNKYIDIPEQGEEIKNKLLSKIKDSFIKLKDSKTNKDIIIRNSQLNEINNHNQKAPFINYEILDNKKEKVYTTKDLAKQVLSQPKNNYLILCYDETQKNKEFFIPLEKIQNAKLDGDDLFDIGNNQQIIFKNIRVKKLDESPKLGVQPEEEKMLKVINLINKINAGPLNKNYKTKDIDGKPCFISNNYISKFQNDTKNDENDTKYKINDSFGKNKITLNKGIITKNKNPGDYIIIKNKKDNKEYLVDLNDLLNNLKKFKSIDDDIIITNAMDNTNMKLNPLDIEIVPPFNNYPLQKIFAKKIIPVKKNENKNENLNINNEKDKEEEERKVKKNEPSNQDEIKERIRLRSAPARQRAPEKKSYKIRRAIIYKKQKKDH